MFTPRSPKVAISLLSSICWHRDQSVICLRNWTLACNLQISIVGSVTTKHFASRWPGRDPCYLAPPANKEWDLLNTFQAINIKLLLICSPAPVLVLMVGSWISWESCVTSSRPLLCSRPPLQWTLGFYEQQFPHHQLLSGETKSVMSLL